MDVIKHAINPYTYIIVNTSTDFVNVSFLCTDVRELRVVTGGVMIKKAVRLNLNYESIFCFIKEYYFNIIIIM